MVNISRQDIPEKSAPDLFSVYKSFTPTPLESMHFRVFPRGRESMTHCAIVSSLYNCACASRVPQYPDVVRVTVRKH